MRQLTLIIDDLTDAFSRLGGVADMVILEMRALAHAADEMQVRTEAVEYHHDAPEPVSVALGRCPVGAPRRPTYFADGADLEYG